jgi:hypothetical protein
LAAVAKRVMTNNGTDNAPMLAINRALRFGASSARQSSANRRDGRELARASV